MPILLDNGLIGEPVAATIGMFDGVHRGHRFVLSQLCSKAKEKGLKTAAITFKRHPLCVVRKGFSQPLLMGLDARLHAIEAAGIDYVVAMDFTKELSALTAEQFLRLIHDRYCVRMLLTGYDNRFGSRRSDGFDDYVAYGNAIGVEVEKCGEYNPGGEKICSSAIRRSLAEGDVAAANAMLGRRYSLGGKVVGGFANGRKMGFPTANIDAEPSLAVPGNGVYAVFVHLPGGQTKQGMLNIGNRPTFANGSNRTVEVNIFDFCADIYGESIEVEFAGRIRDERKMESVGELEKQLASDREKAKEILSKS